MSNFWCRKRLSMLTNSSPGNAGNCILESTILKISQGNMPLIPLEVQSLHLWHEQHKSASRTSVSGTSKCYQKPDWIGSHLTEVWLHYHRRGEGKTVLYKCKPTNKFRSHLEILTHFTDFTELQQGIHMVRMSM